MDTFASTFEGLETKPVSRRDRRRAEMRARIIDAALDLFAHQDYNATTVEQITEAADVGKGTFFNYFSCKEHLLATHSAMVLDKFASALQRADAADKPLRVVLRQACQVLADDPRRNPHLERNLLGALFSSSHALEHVSDTIRKGLELLTSVFAEAQRKNEVRKDLAPSQLARLAIHTFFGASIMWAFDPSVQFPKWLDQCFDTMWDGISAAHNKRRGNPEP